MTIDRRKLLQGGATLLATSSLPGVARAEETFAPKPGTWRSFEVVTRLEIAQPSGQTQAWIPLPSVNEKDWFKSHPSRWTSNGAASLKRDPAYGADMLHVEWEKNEASPAVEVISIVTTQNRAVSLTSPASDKADLSAADRALNTAATRLIPTDGIVKTTSDKITAGAKTDIEKVHAIYEWIVENTFRDAKVRGCGIGDIAAMLASGNLGGKCADLNALFVGLVRAADIPARDIYGIRVAPSNFGYKSLGANSQTITKAQHCRAEVFLNGYGWVAMDPADVRKVALEEPPANLAITDPKVAAARKTLFGSWEGNWLAYNFAHDIALPGSSGPNLGFLMYPQAETAGLRLDCLDADTFKYSITAKEITNL